MHPNAIKHEIQQLYNVSNRLDSLAEPLVTEALLTISGSLRNTATLLEVLVAMKRTPLFGLDPADAYRLLLWRSERKLVVKNNVQK
jgi:hypothetical protein